jgi:hypothetical protein
MSIKQTIVTGTIVFVVVVTVGISIFYISLGEQGAA